LLSQKIGTAHVIFSRNSFFNSEGGWRLESWWITQHDSKKMVHILVTQMNKTWIPKRKRKLSIQIEKMKTLSLFSKLYTNNHLMLMAPLHWYVQRSNQCCSVLCRWDNLWLRLYIF
jgi:hypothetical protein